jgi:hypothetical protein
LPGLKCEKVEEKSESVPDFVSYNTSEGWNKTGSFQTSGLKEGQDGNPPPF